MIIGSKKRNSTSKVWDDFDELFNMWNGQNVSYGARYKYCGHEDSGKSSNDTGHLHRHTLICLKKKEMDRMTHSVLKYNVDGSIHRWLLLLVLNFVV